MILYRLYTLNWFTVHLSRSIPPRQGSGLDKGGRGCVVQGFKLELGKKCVHSKKVRKAV